MNQLLPDMLIPKLGLECTISFSVQIRHKSILYLEQVMGCVNCCKRGQVEQTCVMISTEIVMPK